MGELGLVCYIESVSISKIEYITRENEKEYSYITN